MKLMPADAWLQTYDRPLLNSRVAIADPANPDQEWAFYLRLRLTDSDLATTPLTLSPVPMTTTLIVRDAGVVLRYPVVLEPLMAPIAAWRIRYQGEPDRQEARREWRNDQDRFTGWLRTFETEATEWIATTSYDFSPSALRFFAPWSLAPDTLVVTRWQLDNDRIEGTLRVIRQEPAPLWWNKQQGYATVGEWAQLTEPMRYRWRTYCWRHQPDKARS